MHGGCIKNYGVSAVNVESAVADRTTNAKALAWCRVTDKQ